MTMAIGANCIIHFYYSKNFTWARISSYIFRWPWERPFSIYWASSSRGNVPK